MAIAFYARKSVERENSISCETQLEYCRAMLHPDEKHEEIIEYIDNGFSGGNIHRDGFQMMMRQVEKGKIQKIIVYRLDRISRSLVDFVGILETLKRYRVEFCSSQESFDTSSPYGEMIVKILMVFAEFERQSIIARVTQAYAHRSEKGFYMGGRRPYGFTLVETELYGIKTKMLAPEEREVKQLQDIFERYAVSGVSLRRLMQTLIQNNTFPTTGNWSTAKLSAIIKNPIYVKADHAIYAYYRKHNTQIVSDIEAFDGIHGLQLYGKSKHKTDDFSDMKAVVMTHEGVISSEIWLDCQKKLEKNRKLGNSLSNTTSWLGGKLICKLCGRKMTVTKGAKHADGSRMRYFNCTGKTHNRACKGANPVLYADSLEAMADKLIAEKLLTLQNGRKKVSVRHEGTINMLKNRMLGIQKEQAKLVDFMLQQDMVPDIMKLLNERAKGLSDEADKLQKKLEALETEALETVCELDFSERWANAEYEERKAVVQLLIDNIYVDEDGTTEIVWNI